MNIEKWVAGRQVYWQKLEDLLKKIDSKGLSSLSREELQSIGRLYRSAASDLSRARILNVGTDIIAYLNSLVVKGHNQVYQSPRNRWRDLWNFLWYRFPAVFRQNIFYVLISFLLFAIPCAGTWSMIVADPRTGHLEIIPGHAIVPDELWVFVEHNKLWTDAVEGESPAASSFIATNNIKVTMISFVTGILAGLGTIFLLVTNGMNIGGAFAACQLHGMVWRLVAFVAPHGVFELSAIFIGGGAGLMLAKGLLFPGSYTRADSMKLMAREASILFLGCVPLLLIAGMIEGYVSPRTDLPQLYKFGVSFATFLLLVLYLVVPRQQLKTAVKVPVVESLPVQKT